MFQMPLGHPEARDLVERAAEVRASTAPAARGSSRATCWPRVSRAGCTASSGSCARTPCGSGRPAVSCRRTRVSGPPPRRISWNGGSRPTLRTGIGSPTSSISGRLGWLLRRRPHRPVLPPCRGLADAGQHDGTARHSNLTQGQAGCLAASYQIRLIDSGRFPDRL